MRRVSVIIVLAGCMAPAGENHPPGLELLGIQSGNTIPESEILSVVVAVFDRDRDPLTVSVFHENESEPLDSTTAVAGGQVQLQMAPGTAPSVMFRFEVTDGISTFIRELPLIVNRQLSTPQIAIYPENPRTGDDLELIVLEPPIDPEGMMPVESAEWTQEDISFTGFVLDAEHTKEGQIWQATYTTSESFEDGSLNPYGQSVSVTTEVRIENTNPSTPIVAVSPAHPTPLHDLLCTAISEDVDEDPLVYTYRWSLEGVLTEHIGPLLSNRFVEPGEWTCTAIAFDEQNSSESSSDTAEVVLPENFQDGVLITGNAAGDRFGSSVQLLSLYDDGQTIPGTADLVVNVPHYSLSSYHGAAAVYRGDTFAGGSWTNRDVSLNAYTSWTMLENSAVFPDLNDDGVQEFAVHMLYQDTHMALVVPSEQFSRSPSMVGSYIAPFAGTTIEDANASDGFGAEFVGAGIGEQARVAISDIRLEAVFWFTRTVLDARAGTGCHPSTSSCVTTTEGKRIDTLSPGDGFGNSISLGDWDENGAIDLLVGAAGAVYLFLDDTLTSDEPLSTAHADRVWIASGSQVSANVAWLGDLDGDGTQEIGIGAPDIGRVWIVSATAWDGELDDVASWILDGEADGDGFGAEIVSLGDSGPIELPEGYSRSPEFGIVAAVDELDTSHVYLFAGSSFEEAEVDRLDARIILSNGLDIGRLMLFPGADLDLDGFLDFSLSAPNYNDERGQVSVFLSDG